MKLSIFRLSYLVNFKLCSFKTSNFVPLFQHDRPYLDNNAPNETVSAYTPDSTCPHQKLFNVVKSPELGASHIVNVNFPQKTRFSDGNFHDF